MPDFLQYFPHNYLNSQLACPRGGMGRLLARQLEREAHRQRIEWAVEQLQLDDEDQVLDVGFGTGYSLELIARQIPLGSLVGVDHSSLMVRYASERLQQIKQELPLALIAARVENLPRLEQKFNKVLAVNTLAHWDNKEVAVRAIRERMLADGRIVIVQQPLEPKPDEEAVKRLGRGIQKLLDLAGFMEIRVQTNHDLRPVPAVAVTAYS